MNSKIKLLIIYNKIWPYRLKIFNMLSEKYDLTVSYSEKNKISEASDKLKFNILYLPVKNYGPFIVHENNLRKIAKEFNVVIGIANIRWVSLMSLIFFKKRNYKLGLWGIGVTASYKRDFDSNEFMNKIRYEISKKTDFTIFYSDYPLDKYISAGVKKQKLFVANNTVQVLGRPEFDVTEKNSFLFIGTLYREKGIDLLLESYKKLVEMKDGVPDLIIVGDGPERKWIDNYVKNENLSNKVLMLGSVYDDNELVNIFNKTIACISPNQAGLSVLKAMGNGTMFVTKTNAITGGEIFNIKNGENGILYNSDDELTDVLAYLIDNPEKTMKMNRKAYEYYIKYRKPKFMAESIINAINNSLIKRV